MDTQNQRYRYGNRATLLFFKVLAYGRTDSHVTTKFFQIDGLLNFLRYKVPLARLWRAGAPLMMKNIP